MFCRELRSRGSGEKDTRGIVGVMIDEEGLRGVDHLVKKRSLIGVGIIEIDQAELIESYLIDGAAISDPECRGLVRERTNDHAKTARLAG